MFYCGPMKIEKLNKCNVSNAGIALIVLAPGKDALSGRIPQREEVEIIWSCAKVG